jgi:hypothetical protein
MLLVTHGSSHLSIVVLEHFISIHSPVHSRFGSDTMKNARVIQIDPRHSQFPITTSEDDYLPRGHHIKVLARLMKNNQLIPVQDPVFVTDLGLAKGTYDGVLTKSEKLADFYRKTQKELTDAFEQKNDPNPTEETTTTTTTTACSAMEDELVLAPPLPPPASSRRSSVGKRKSTFAESSGRSSNARKLTEPKSPKQPQHQLKNESWRSELEDRLQQIQEAAKKRRADTTTLALKARALETALTVRSTCDDENHLQTLVQQVTLGTTEQRLHFLTGNTNNLLTNRVLGELTQAWEDWLRNHNHQHQTPEAPRE